MSNEVALVGAVVLLAAVVVVFVVLREFTTWYWKQSEQVELLKRIAASLEALDARAAGKPAAPPAPARPRTIAEMIG